MFNYGVVSTLKLNTLKLFCVIMRTIDKTYGNNRKNQFLIFGICVYSKFIHKHHAFDKKLGDTHDIRCWRTIPTI